MKKTAALLLSLLLAVPVLGADLTGTTPANTYKDLVQVPNSNSGIDATLRQVQSGNGTAWPLWISTLGVALKPADLGTALSVPLAADDADAFVVNMPGPTGYANFALHRDDGAVFDGVRDPMMSWGYNIAANGAAPGLAGEHSLVWRLEADYKSGSDRWIENYLEFLGSDGTTTFRPVIFGIDTATNAKSEIGFVASKFTLYNLLKSREASFDVTFNASGATMYLTNASFAANSNNVYLLKGKNAAGSTYVNTLKLDSADELVLGEDYAPSIYPVKTFGKFKAFHIPATGTESENIILSRSGFGNTAGHSACQVWGYNAGTATQLGKLCGVVVSGGMELAFSTYASSAIAERARISATGISTPGSVTATGGFSAGAGPSAGMTTVITVRDSGGAGDCTITVTGGIITATTCSHT